MRLISSIHPTQVKRKLKATLPIPTNPQVQDFREMEIERVAYWSKGQWIVSQSRQSCRVTTRKSIEPLRPRSGANDANNSNKAKRNTSNEPLDHCLERKGK